MRVPRGKAASYAAIVALVVLNAVLIFMLLRPPEPPQSEPRPAFTPEPATTSAGPTDSLSPPAPEPAPTPEPTADEAAPAGAQPAQRLLAAASDSVAWRASTGSCEAPGVVEYTEDGGATWAPREPGVTPVSRLKVQSGSALVLIGGTADCAPTYAATSDAGDTWVTADEYLAGSWYLLPGDRTRLNAPTGEVAAPCAGEPVGLAGLDSQRGAVLCADGTLQVTSDGGAAWAPAGSAPDALALGLRADGYVLATASPACTGLAVLLLDPAGAGLPDDGGNLPDGAGCAPVTDAQPGQVAVSGTQDAIWLWSGDEVLVSADAAQTW